MKFENRTITLKDGRECVLRPTTAEYAQDMIDYLKLTATESPFLLREPEEVTYTLEQEKEILTNLYENKKSVMMLAVVEGKVAGNCSINGLGDKQRIRHRCGLAIALKKEFWGLGIGNALLNYLSELAERIGYEQIELEVVDGNDTAKRLYEKCGFVETGRRVRAMKYKDGSYRDEFIMTKVL
ncbi:MAG: GNAT family N-acetyltransferase [Eubacteriales bacterium]|nr:GNAT family N-acetyltransferase [Eubacteriales bacterium]